MSRRGLYVLILISAFLQIGLVTVGRFVDDEQPASRVPDKMWQTRLYFPLHPGDETIAPPRVIVNHFPGPM